MSKEEIERILAGLARAPLGMDTEDEFRISVPGAQEKTALLLKDGKGYARRERRLCRTC